MPIALPRPGETWTLTAASPPDPVGRLGVDGASLFADILLIVEPLGVGLEFGRGEGPQIQRPLRGEAQIAHLTRIDVDAAVPFVFETVGRVRQALAGRVPLI